MTKLQKLKNVVGKIKKIKKFRYYFESYTEYYGNDYVTTTKVYDSSKTAACKGFKGCHWDSPDIIYISQRECFCWGKECASLIERLGAIDIESLTDEHIYYERHIGCLIQK